MDTQLKNLTAIGSIDMNARTVTRRVTKKRSSVRWEQ